MFGWVSYVENRKILLGLTAAFMFLGLMFAVLKLYSFFSTNELASVDPELSWVWVAVSLLLAYFFSALAWNLQLRMIGSSSAIMKSLFDMGYIALGKYVPGKIVGILARGASNANAKTYNSVYLSALDQIGLLLIGLIFSGTLFLVSKQIFSGVTSFFVILVIYLLAVFVLRVLYFLYAVISLSASTKLYYRRAFSFFFKLSFLFFVCWGLTSFSLYPLLPENLNEDVKLQLVSAFCISVVGGWVAVFVPAGIGVREGLFVLFSNHALPIDASLVIAASHRVIVIFVDIVFALACMLVLYLRRRTIAS